ncbi:Molybdenum cofactor biosynthesis protein MoaB [hydrothermal vent metagenome]|uniref:Molybdenum cofactor biosynthesis protein MoaB n=1 Tax=hydrothermal vent metagenome TaxID=652676 RepID=A0A3B0VWH2_9ZZZZ
MSSHPNNKTFKPLSIAVLTVSDTRNEDTDTSGLLLKEKLLEAGHQLAEKKIIKDDLFHIRAVLSDWIHRSDVQVVLITGGTGFTPRDNTPQAVKPLFIFDVPGFGELFRHISYGEINTSTVQSRALAGIANGTLIACMPGSTNACRTAWNKILKDQLDSTHKPCNFVEHLKTAEVHSDHIDGCETRG